MLRLILDTSVLGKICHPKPNLEISGWIKGVLEAGKAVIFIPEIADYELRRELVRIKSQISLDRLDQLENLLEYVPIETSHMRKAAELWAKARSKGNVTAPKEALDGDVILAAQAIAVNATVLTENVKHLSWFVDVKSWQDLV